MKEQSINGMNDSDIILEIIKELTETEENENVTIEQGLAWARRVEAQKGQSSILKYLNETNDFDKISIWKRVQRQVQVQP